MGARAWPRIAPGLFVFQLLQFLRSGLENAHADQIVRVEVVLVEHLEFHGLVRAHRELFDLFEGQMLLRELAVQATVQQLLRLFGLSEVGDLNIPAQGPGAGARGGVWVSLVGFGGSGARV